MKKNNITRILFGLIFIFLAVILSGNLFAWWNITNFNGWWTVFLIIPGLAGIISCGLSFWNVFLIVLGTVLLVKEQGVFQFIDGRYFWVLLLAAIGIWLILKPILKRNLVEYSCNKTNVYFTKENKNVCHDDFINYTAAFGGIETYSDSQQLIGANLTSVFAGIDLDLTPAKIENGAIITVNSIFGGVKINLPKECNVKVTGVPLFGGVSNRHLEQHGNECSSVVTVKYTALFGGVELH